VLVYFLQNITQEAPVSHGCILAVYKKDKNELGRNKMTQGSTLFYSLVAMYVLINWNNWVITKY